MESKVQKDKNNNEYHGLVVEDGKEIYRTSTTSLDFNTAYTRALNWMRAFIKDRREKAINNSKRVKKYRNKNK